MSHLLKGKCYHIYNWLLKLLFSQKLIRRSLCTINHNDIQSKVIVSFHANNEPSLVVIFVCLSSSNSYNNMLIYDIVQRIIQQC